LRGVKIIIRELTLRLQACDRRELKASSARNDSANSSSRQNGEHTYIKTIHFCTLKRLQENFAISVSICI